MHAFICLFSIYLYFILDKEMETENHSFEVQNLYLIIFPDSTLHNTSIQKFVDFSKNIYYFSLI